MLAPLAVRAFAAALCLMPVAVAQQREAVVPPVTAAKPPAEFEGDGNSCTAAQMQEAHLWWLYEGDALLGRERRPLSPAGRAAVAAAVRRALACEPQPAIAADLVLASAFCGSNRHELETAAGALPDTPEVSARVCLARGACADPSAVASLLAIAAERAQDTQVRAAALIGLALAAHAGTPVRHEALQTLVTDSFTEAGEDLIHLRHAALAAWREACPQNLARLADPAVARDRALEWLWQLHDQDAAPLDVRAQCAVLVAALARQFGDPDGRHARRMAELLPLGDDRHRWPLGIGAALALGMLGEGRPDAAVERALLAAWSARHPQMRGSVRLALGRSGGPVGIELLRREVGEGREARELLWSALGLGLHAWRLRQVGDVAASELGACVFAAARQLRAFERDVALVALGLCGSPLLLERPDLLTDSEYTAHACELLGDPAALPHLTAIRQPSAWPAVASARVALGEPGLIDEDFARLARGRWHALPALALRIDTEHLDRLLTRLASERAADRRMVASWLPTLLNAERGEPLAKFGRGWNYRWVSNRLLFHRW